MTAGHDKTCTRCGETKPEGEFYLRTVKGGRKVRRAECKPCSSKLANTPQACATRAAKAAALVRESKQIEAAAKLPARPTAQVPLPTAAELQAWYRRGCPLVGAA